MILCSNYWVSGIVYCQIWYRCLPRPLPPRASANIDIKSVHDWFMKGIYRWCTPFALLSEPEKMWFGAGRINKLGMWSDWLAGSFTDLISIGWQRECMLIMNPRLSSTMEWPNEKTLCSDHIMNPSFGPSNRIWQNALSELVKRSIHISNSVQPCLWIRNCKQIFRIFPAYSLFDHVCAVFGTFTKRTDPNRPVTINPASIFHHLAWHQHSESSLILDGRQPTLWYRFT